MLENTKDFADAFLCKEPKSEKAQKVSRAVVKNSARHCLTMVPNDLEGGYVPVNKNVCARGFKRAEAKRNRAETKRTRPIYKTNGFGN